MAKKYIRYEDYLEVVKSILAQYDIPITIRQLYYRVISDPYNLLENNANAYQNLDAMTVKMRERGDIDWRKIEDRTRGTEGEDYEDSGDPDEYISSRVSSLRYISRWYNLPMWETQPSYVEVWVEKDALAKIVSNVTNGLKMVSFPTRGYGSFTSLKEAAIRLYNQSQVWDWDEKGKGLDCGYRTSDKKIIILYLGDFDPTGLDVDVTVSQKVMEYGGGNFEFRRIALTMEQVEEYNLTPNFAKISDTRAAKYIARYGKDTWELDALPPDVLTKIIEDEINELIDWDIWKEREEEINKIRCSIRKKMEPVSKLIDGLEAKDKESDKEGE